MNAMDWRVNLLTDKFRFMNAGTANVIPVKLFPLDPFFNVFNRWQLPLQFFRQAAGYFIRTDTHRLGHNCQIPFWPVFFSNN